MLRVADGGIVHRQPGRGLALNGSFDRVHTSRTRLLD